MKLTFANLLTAAQKATWNTAAGRLAARWGLGRLLRRLLWHRAYRRGVMATRLAGYPVRVHIAGDDDVQRAQKFWREQAMVSRLLGCFREGDHFWDVGANAGLVTLVAGKALGPLNGWVTAFEPHPVMYEQLARNVHANELSHVKTRELALGEASTTAPLYVADRPAAGTHTLIDAAGGTSVEIAVERGQTLASSDGAFPNVIKIDVEGAEDRVLEGCRPMLSQPALRDLFVELHPQSLGTEGVTAIDQLLVDSGFTLAWSCQRDAEEQRHYCRAASSAAAGD